MLQLINFGKIANVNNIFYCFDKNNDQYKYLVTSPENKPLKDNPIKKLHPLQIIGVVYQNRWDQNFRHFINETFVILSKFFKNGKFDNKLKIIIKPNCPKHNLQVLKILGLEKNIFILNSLELVQCKELYVSNKKINNQGNIQDFLDFFIKKCKEMSKIKFIPKMKNLYLSREKYDKHKGKYTPKRWVTNFYDIKDLIYNKFYTIETHNLNLWDQVTYLNNADNVITLIGASCDNILFLKKDANFICLYPKFCRYWAKQYKEYKIIGKFIGVLCGFRDKNVYYNPIWGGDDKLNGPWYAKYEIVLRTINKFI